MQKHRNAFNKIQSDILESCYNALLTIKERMLKHKKTQCHNHKLSIHVIYILCCMFPTHKTRTKKYKKKT